MTENLLIVSIADVLIHPSMHVLIYCKGVDRQEFRNLTAGTYTLFIEATATENTNEVAYDTVGPVILAIGANATVSEAIGKPS